MNWISPEYLKLFAAGMGVGGFVAILFGVCLAKASARRDRAHRIVKVVR